MARTWLSIRVDLIGGRGENLWPRPGRVFAASRSHTFWQLAEAIDDAFARWDRAHPNLSTGTSIKINASGQGRFHMDSELMYAHGPWELDVPDDISTPQFDGKLIFVNGNTVFSTATTDVLSSTTPVRDLCAELAA